jgi:uncharacterized SAM-binding protein YcdF (DUF218 family)
MDTGLEMRKKETTEALKNLVKGRPNAFLVLTGNMRELSPASSKAILDGRKYKTSSFGVGDENSVRALGVSLPAGGRDRVLAAVEMHRAYPDAYVVSMSKSRDEKKPTYAMIIAKELAEKGVDEKKILLEEVSVDTITEFKEAAKLWKKHGWDNIVFILAEWHVPRATALLNHIEDFTDTDEERKLLSEFVECIQTDKLTVQFLDTTKVLSTQSSKYKYFFEKRLANDPGMQARIRAEEGGIQQIAEGTYGGRTLTHKIWKDKT